MVFHSDIDSKEALSMIRKGEIVLGGNKRLKIYGTLGCTSGKRMKRENRVFFKSDAEARKMGFRPSGHCMKEAYKQWKDGFVHF